MLRKPSKMPAMTQEIDAETAQKLDDDAIEADEIISDEIPDEFLAFI